jgi:alkylated DNA repair dioxygenase AlkB
MTTPDNKRPPKPCEESLRAAIRLWPHTVSEHLDLLNTMVTSTVWETQWSRRKTASYGRSYDYSGISYPEKEFPLHLARLLPTIENHIGFSINNCLINCYPDGNSAMGFHADNIGMLAPDTGVAIVSLGASRILQFRQIADHSQHSEVLLTGGSLFYMPNWVQLHWQHSLAKTKEPTSMRISLTFRHIQGDTK